MKYNAIDSKALKIRHDTPAMQFRYICAITYDVDVDADDDDDKIIKGGGFFSSIGSGVHRKIKCTYDYYYFMNFSSSSFSFLDHICTERGT